MCAVGSARAHTHTHDNAVKHKRLTFRGIENAKLVFTECGCHPLHPKSNQNASARFEERLVREKHIALEFSLKNQMRRLLVGEVRFIYQKFNQIDYIS